MFFFIVLTAKGEQRGVTSVVVIVYCTVGTVILCVCVCVCVGTHDYRFAKNSQCK